VANIVVVSRKDGKIRASMDYKDLNKASSKDGFPLPHINVLVNNATKSAVYSFMDELSGYNQIRKTKENKEKTNFFAYWGTFCYKVMPYGLKNV